jgi:DNA-binding response OmpR family regulator
VDESYNNRFLHVRLLLVLLTQGIDATKEIRAKGFLEIDLPVVALTASIQSVDWVQVGMNDCMKKPVRLVDLKRCLAKNCRNVSPPSLSEEDVTSFRCSSMIGAIMDAEGGHEDLASPKGFLESRSNPLGIVSFDDN